MAEGEREELCTTRGAGACNTGCGIEMRIGFGGASQDSLHLATRTTIDMRVTFHAAPQFVRSRTSINGAGKAVGKER